MINRMGGEKEFLEGALLTPEVVTTLEIGVKSNGVNKINVTTRVTTRLHRGSRRQN